jgi:hypothetical protein
MQETGSRRKRPKRTGNSSQERSNQQHGLHGLLGLEISALRKSFDGQPKYDFNSFLKTSIPEQYAIDIIDETECMNKLIQEEEGGLKLFEYQGDNGGTFEEMQKTLRGNFEINLVDHARIKGPDVSLALSGIDPLDDCVYEKAHERLARREKKYSMSDRDKMMTEVDNCLELLSVLGTDLKKSTLKDTLPYYVVEDVEINDDQIFRLSHLLGTITTINDPTNTFEMILKYRLTVREVRSFLLNFLKVKTLEFLLKKEVQRTHSLLQDPFIEPVTESKMNDLRERRLADRNKRMGKIVPIRFKDGVELLVDPICSPRVVVRNMKHSFQ